MCVFVYVKAREKKTSGEIEKKYGCRESVYVCVFVCVCEREKGIERERGRERERERDKGVGGLRDDGDKKF